MGIREGCYTVKGVTTRVLLLCGCYYKGVTSRVIKFKSCQKYWCGVCRKTTHQFIWGFRPPRPPRPPTDPLKSPKYPVMPLNAPPLQNPPNTLIPLTFGFQGHFAKFWARARRAVQPESKNSKTLWIFGGGGHQIVTP